MSEQTAEQGGQPMSEPVNLLWTMREAGLYESGGLYYFRIEKGKGTTGWRLTDGHSSCWFTTLAKAKEWAESLVANAERGGADVSHQAEALESIRKAENQ